MRIFTKHDYHNNNIMDMPLYFLKRHSHVIWDEKLMLILGLIIDGIDTNI